MSVSDEQISNLIKKYSLYEQGGAPLVGFNGVANIIDEAVAIIDKAVKKELIAVLERSRRASAITGLTLEECIIDNIEKL